MKVHATCGRGTEIFAKDEVINRLQAHVLSVEDGKVFFQLEGKPKEASKILELKTVERVFATVTHFGAAEIKGNGKVKFLHDLKHRILEPTALKEAADQVFSVHKSNGLNHHGISHACDTQLPENSKRQLTSSPSVNECSKAVCRKLSVLKRKAEEPPRRQLDLSVSDQNYTVPPSSADVRVSDQSEDQSQASVVQGCPLEKRIHLDQDESNSKPARTSCVESSSASQSQKDTSVRNGATFRVSVKCAGWCRKWLQPQRLAKECGLKLSWNLGWKVDLQSPQIEVCIHVNDDFITVGIPLTQQPLSKRSYILNPGLRSTVSWIMAHLAEIQPNDRVLDPMCGKATILLEAAMLCAKGAEFIGCDHDQQQLEGAFRNIAFANLSHCVQLICTDATNLPLRDASVERIVCDAPFGLKFTINTCQHSFYWKLLKELYRVLKLNGRVVLLTSQDLHDIVKHCIQHLHLTKEEPPFEQQQQSVGCSSSANSGNDANCQIHCTDVTDTSVTSSPLDRLHLSDSFRNVDRLSLKTSHYVKLGETHAYIMVLEKDTCAVNDR